MKCTVHLTKALHTKISMYGDKHVPPMLERAFIHMTIPSGIECLILLYVQCSRSVKIVLGCFRTNVRV